METSRVALIALVCVGFSGAEVELRVRRGDDVTLSCDCVWELGLNTAWFRNCSEKNHPSLIISFKDLMSFTFPRYSFVFNNSTHTHSLLIKNFTDSDQGLYYCATGETILSKDKDGVVINRLVYHYGERLTRLTRLETAAPSTPCLCVSERSVSWTLVFGVCVACVLVSSLVSSVCVYRLCTNTTEAKCKADVAGRDKRTTRRRVEVGEDEVCYASLDTQNLERMKTKRKKRVQQSDFSTYSEVRSERSREELGGAEKS